MRNIVILNSLHFSYPLPILMRVSYNTLIVKQNTSDYYKYTNKRGQCQIYLNIAEREYLRRSQRYEKSGAEANYFQFCLTRTEHPRRNRRQKVRSYRPQRTSSGRTPPSIPRTGDKRATTTAYGRAASGGRRIRTVRNRRQQDAGT